MRQTIATTGKACRADPVASCLERGYQRRAECPNTGGPWWGLDAMRGVQDQRDGIRLFAGTWTQDYLDEVEGFPPPGDGLCDQVDATSGAWAWLEAHPVGAMLPMGDEKPKAKTGHDVHPEDADALEDAGETRDDWRRG